jgi:hypothetical protein
METPEPIRLPVAAPDPQAEPPSVWEILRRWRQFADLDLADKSSREYRYWCVRFMADTLVDIRAATPQNIMDYLGSIPGHGQARILARRAMRALLPAEPALGCRPPTTTRYGPGNAPDLLGRATHRGSLFPGPRGREHDTGLIEIRDTKRGDDRVHRMDPASRAAVDHLLPRANGTPVQCQGVGMAGPVQDVGLSDRAPPAEATPPCAAALGRDPPAPTWGGCASSHGLPGAPGPVNVPDLPSTSGAMRPRDFGADPLKGETSRR